VRFVKPKPAVFDKQRPCKALNAQQTQYKRTRAFILFIKTHICVKILTFADKKSWRKLHTSGFLLFEFMGDYTVEAAGYE
jgi:hypothetical protein